MDLAIFQWINGWSDAFAPFFVFWSESNKWWPVRVGLILLLLGMLAYSKGTRRAAILAVLALVLANEATDFIKAARPTLRPCVELDAVNLRVGKLTSFGTASAHSANMAAVATVFGRELGKWGYLWIPVALLTGLSRVYVGVHYPWQVLLGWTTGILIALILTEGWRWWVKRTKEGSMNPKVRLESEAEAIQGE